MPNFNTIVVIILVSCSVANAGVICHHDSFGKYICIGTGNDIGFRSELRNDGFGTDIYSDNKGNEVRCHDDTFGNYVCN